MSRKFIALIVAASLTVTGITASQAQAGDKRTRNLIVGAAALAILGAAIAEQDKRHNHGYVGTQNPRPRGHSHPRHDPKYGYHDRDRRNPFAHGPRSGVTPRPLPPRAQFAPLPNQCLRSFHGRGGGTFQLYAARCLNRNYHAAHSLPQNCRQDVRLRNGHFRGYNPACLRQHHRHTRNAWMQRK